MLEPPDPAHLDDLIDALEARLLRNEIDSAAAGFDTIAGEILEIYEAYEDEEGTLASLAQRCADGLIACLAATDPARDVRLRHTILNSLFELYCQDLDTGGHGIGDGIPGAIAEHATSEERSEVAGWIENVLPEDVSFRQDDQRQALGRFLLTVQEDALDEEAALTLLRRSGDPFALLDKLLEFGRIGDAVDVVRAMPDHLLLRAADRLVAHGHATHAQRLVEARQATRDDVRFLAWLRDHAETNGDPEEALRLSEILFWRPPTLESYRRLERLARSLDRWNELRRAVLERLEHQNQNVLLTDIHLHGGDATAALALLRDLPDEHVFTPDPRTPDPLAVRVAEAAEDEHPETAAELYERQAQELIALRGRQNYAEAAALLRRARAIWLQLGQEERSTRFLEELRSQHARLRALTEELDEAGL